MVRATENLRLGQVKTVRQEPEGRTTQVASWSASGHKTTQLRELNPFPPAMSRCFPASAAISSEQLPELLGGETGIASDGSHRDGVDRVVARNHQAPLTIAEDQMARLSDNPIAQLLKDAHSLLLADSREARHYRASSRVSTRFTPASSASTSSQRPMASRMFWRASSRDSPWEWQPGRSRQLTDQPSSVSKSRILYDTRNTARFHNPSQTMTAFSQGC